MARHATPSWYWLAVPLLWLAFFLRVHDALTMPVFVDESLHILRGQVVWRFSDPGESLIPKKLLYYYWIGLVGLDTARAVWLARTATALLALPGGALAYGLAARLFDRRAGVLALALVAVAPFGVFFERLALADGLATVLGLAVVVTGLRLAARPSMRLGVLTGALLGLTLLAKLTALPLALLPPLAVALFAPGAAGRPWRDAPRVPFSPPYRWPLALALLACAAVLLPSLAYVVSREASGAPRVVLEESLYAPADRLAAIAGNLALAGRAAWTLLGPELVLLAGIAALSLSRRRPRALGYLLAGIALPWGGAVLVAADLSTRYLLLGVPYALIAVAGGVTGAAPRLRWVGGLVLAVWLVRFALPFDALALRDPARLDLPPRDTWEYVTNTSAGYALRELAADLPGLPPGADGRVRVIGFLPACHSLPLYWPMPTAVDLACPLFKWDPADQQGMAARLVDAVAAGAPAYMAVDETGVFDLTALPLAWDLLAEYPRPRGGKVVRLYRVALAGEGGPP